MKLVGRRRTEAEGRPWFVMVGPANLVSGQHIVEGRFHAEVELIVERRADADFLA